jgi:hypothetical protein
MVGLGDGRRDGQAEPEPAGLPAAVRFGAGEAAEDVVQVGRRDAAAGVGHGDDRVRAFEPDADLDAVTRLGVRDGVLQQRVQRHDEPVGITGDGGLGGLA